MMRRLFFCVLLLLPAEIAFAVAPLNVRDFGAKGDGTTKDTAAIQRALDACAEAGGGEVVVPEGDYLVGSLELKSNMTLQVAEHAILRGTKDLDDYPIVKVRWEGRTVDGHRALISARDASHIAIVGKGQIIGEPTLGGRQMPRRPCVIEPIECKDVRIEGLTLTQKQMWTTHPTYCEDVTMKNVTIRSVGGNSDGVDVDSCKHVRIEGCDIESGDDCVAIKSGRGMEGYRANRPTEDVQIRNCTLADTNFACVGIGSESSGGIRGVRIERCKFTQAKSFAIYIKSRPGRGAYIEDISCEDLDVETAPGGFLRVNLLSSGILDPEPVAGDLGIPTARDYQFFNVRVKCGTLVDAVSISPSKPLDNFTLMSIKGTCAKGIQLANMTRVAIQEIDVTGFEGPLVTTDKVQGSGLENAVEPPTREALWNGKDLAGWKLYLDDKTADASGAWSAVDGVLRLASKSKGYVRSEKAFSNYHLHVEWRWPKDAAANTNSGVLVHMTGDDAIWPSCFECQLKNGNAGQVVGMQFDIPDAPLENNRKRAPRIGDASEKPIGEWNSYDIYARGDFLEAFVNGVRQNRVEKLPASKGSIGLQMEGFPVEFRDIWVQPF
jgi:polygalacturonase